MDSKKSPSPKIRLRAVPVPRDAGWFTLLIIALSFIAGLLKDEMILILTGAVFAGAALYCFAGISLLSFFHRKKCLTLAARPSPALVEAGSVPELFFNGKTPGAGRFFRLPGISLRYELLLATKDGRKWRHIFDPDQPGSGRPQAPERGAYYGAEDSLLIFDILGLFKKALPIPQNEYGARLAAAPAPAPEALFFPVEAGGRESRTRPGRVKTDDLVEHRPYIPGDDPRRINWKLYGHAGGLFVRDGENAPPPRSELDILIDTFADRRLYRPETARRGVDALAAHALALALECGRRGQEARVGYNGSAPAGGEPRELASLLAHPAASFREENFAETAGESVVIFALPRIPPETGAARLPPLDVFLSRRGTTRSIDIRFLYREESMREKAELCARFYDNKRGIHAESARV